MSCSCKGEITISTFLEGISPLITEEALGYVCAKRRISPNTPFSELSERDIDLAEGTMYYWLSNLPVGGSTEKVSDGGWSHSDGGWTVSKANIDEWMRKYRKLFEKWDEEPLDTRTIKLINF